jgi:hypothetical protein
VPYIVRRPRSAPRILPAVAAAVAAVLTFAGPASAEAVAPEVCVTPSFSQAFLPWDDDGLYTLSPGGDFEVPPAGWTLTRGARVVEGNEPFHVGGSADRASLLLPEGAGAVSAPMCVDETYSSFRFFARSASGDKRGLSVEVLWEQSGATRSKKVHLDKAAGAAWTPVKSVRLPAGALSGDGLEPVTFRFEAEDGDWQIDDLYVDPFMRR